MKNNIGFFTHQVDASEHRKFLILRTHYGEGDKGWAMEGRFWRLNSLIGKAEHCRLDTSLKGEKARIAHDLGLGLNDLEEFLTVLETESELIHNENGVIWTDQTQEDLGRVMTKRNADKTRREGQHYQEPQKRYQESKKRYQENNRAERSGEEENSKSERSVGDIATGGESPSAPLRRFSIESLKKKIQDCPIPLSLSPKDLEIVFANFEAADLRDEELEPYLAYAARRASRQSKSSKPNGYFRNVLVTSCDWILAFREEKPKPKHTVEPEGPSIPSPSGCECGSSEYAWNGGDVARCKACGATLEFDPELDAWAVTMAGDPIPVRAMLDRNFLR